MGLIKLRAPPLRVWHPPGLLESQEGRGAHWWVPDPSLGLCRINIEARKSPKLSRAAQELSRSPRLPMRKPSIGSPSLARREFPFEDITQVSEPRCPPSLHVREGG